MKECDDDKCCCSCHCHEGSCGQEDDDMMTEYFLEVADRAWNEVLKDKIKEYILKTQDKRMTELAKIVAEGNNERWRNKMADKQSCSDLEQNLCNFFSHSKKGSK